MTDKNKSKEEIEDELNELRAILKSKEDLLKSKDVSTKKILEKDRFLYQTSLELVDLPLSDDIYEFIAKKLNKLIKNSIIVVTVYDLFSDSFKVRAVEGKSNILTDFSKKFLGTNLINLKVPLKAFNEAYDEESRNRILSGRLHKIENGLYQVLCGTLPEQITKMAEITFNIGDIYGTGFKSKGKLYGTVNIFLKKGTTWEDEEFLQSLINLFAVALQRRKAESDLEESERKYRKIFENVQDIFYQTDAEGKIIEISPSIERYSGFPRDYLIGRQVETVYADPEDRKKLIKLIQEKGEVNDYELLLKDKFGESTYTSVNAHFLLDENNQPIGIEGSLRDINARKEAEKEASFYRTLIEFTKDPVFVLDPADGFRMVYVNEATCKHYGMEREEILKMRVPDWDPNFDSEKLHELANEIKKQKSLFFETVHRVNSGDLIPVELSANYLMHGDKELFGGYIRDIRRRKEAEKQLIETKNRYKTIFENTGTAMVIFNKDGIVTLINSEMEELLGLKKEEVENKGRWVEFVHPDDLPMMLDYHQQREKDPRSAPSSYETRFIVKGGEVHYTKITVDKIPDTDEYVTSVVDLTDLLNAYKKLEKSEGDLRDALAEKEILLKEIHHRVKNNLMVISSLLNLQSKYIQDEVALDIFRESQNRAKSMALIHERLYRSTDLKRIDFGDYIRTLTTDLYHTYATEARGIKLNMDLEDIMVDINTTVPLGLILNELVTNSLKYAFPEGSEGEINIKFYKKDDELILIIGDDGVGFPEELDFRHTETLGLQLVNNLTNQISGKIELDRTNGTKFKITFKEQYK